MATLSLFDKISVLLEVSKSSKLFIFGILIIIFLGAVLVTTNKKNVKTSRKLFVVLYLFIVVAIFVLYKENILDMIEYLMNNLFSIIYFPNLAIYFAAIIISSIILWVSVFNFRTTKIIKNINIVFYSIINYLLVVLLTIINEQKLDVFDTTSIYTNRSAQAIIELSSTIFILWMIFLTLYKAIRIYQTKDYKVVKRKVVSKKTKRTLPKYVREIPGPKFVKAAPTLVNKIDTSTELKQFENLFTLEDYKLLLSILTERREKEKKDQLRKEREEKEYAKFRELKDLYGVR